MRVKVPAGATGFFSRRPPENHDDATVRAFLTAVHAAARAVGGTVVHRGSPGVTPNFHTFVIAHDGGRIAVLLHQSLPIVALADARVSLHPPVFVDHPAVTAALTECSGMAVWSAATLSAELDDADLSELGPAELDQVKYWAPETVGALMFNYWD